MKQLAFAGAAVLSLLACDSGSSGDGGSGADGGASAGGSGSTSAGAGCPSFPADNAWNQDVSGLPLHPNSDAFIDSIGRDTGLHADFGTVYEGEPIGIPFNVVSGGQPLVPVSFEVSDESDPGPYPIPPGALIEGGPDSDGDRHVIVVESDSCTLYELSRAFPENGGAAWSGYSGAVFDLTSNELRPDTWTSADAAGLPIFPGLVKYDEVMVAGELTHAVRFTVSSSQAGYIDPARHYASNDTDPSRPPMGLRLRMKADFDCSGLSQEVQVLCAGFKKYGLIVADNGSDWYLSGSPDERWNDEALGEVANITGDAFEVVFTGEVKTY